MPSGTVNFDVPITVGVISAEPRGVSAAQRNLVESLLRPDDTVIDIGFNGDIPGGLDMIAVVNACGTTPIMKKIAAYGAGCFAVNPCLCFHPYHAALYNDLALCGGPVLPHTTPDDYRESIRAVRAAKAIKNTTLLVVDPHDEGFRHDEVAAFAALCKKRMGLNITRRSTDELKARAAEQKGADEVLERWYGSVLEGPGEMDEPHMTKLAKLYLAEREMLLEYGAAGITVHDIAGFLLNVPSEVMPNVTYGPLVFDGYLAAEEADIEVLVTELLLYAGLGSHPTMSNIYMAYRDRFDALSSHADYTADMEREDFLQCLNDNTVVASHFSASGVLPPNMMIESRYRVREALPSWPGQSMIVSTPRTGPVVMGRIAQDLSAFHYVRGDVERVATGDRYGWYRGRWLIKIPCARTFAAECLHQHYAICADAESACLDTLLNLLIGPKKR